MTITSYGFDINQIGTSDYPRTVTRQIDTQKTGLVVDIVVNHRHAEYKKSDGKLFGYAKIKILPLDEGSNSSALNWVAPRDINIQQLPLIGEEVLLEYVGGVLMYSRALNKENKVNDNISITTNVAFSNDPNKQNTQETDATLALSGVRISNSVSPTIKSAYIPTVTPIAPEEGDFIVQGRYGHSIRLGSSRFIDSDSYPTPNLLLSVGQPQPDGTGLMYEDLLTNATSVWMVTDQFVPFSPATYDSEATNKAYLRGSEIRRSQFYYKGAQLFLDSDRVVVNAKGTEIQLFAKTEINLSAEKSITLASERNVIVTSNLDTTLKSLEADVFIRGQKNISLKAEEGDITGNATKGNYVIWGKKIFIGSGEDTSQPMVLGGQLSFFLQKLLVALQLLPTVYLPQPSPTAGIAAAEIARQLTELLTDVSLLQGASFNSTSNFTAKENK